MSRNNWSEWWRARRADVAALAVIVICFGLMFLPSLARWRYPLVADSFCYSYPLRMQAFAMLRLVSENFYPGWEATVDGKTARINVADYLLRGVSLSAGQHTVEMRYTAPAARTGAIISICTLLLLAALFFYSRRRRPDLRQAQRALQE